MELGLALTLCGLGVSFWIPALLMSMISIGRKKACTSQTQALVTEIKRKSSSDGSSYHPVYEYEVDGIHYRKTGAYISGQVPKAGTTVSVMYDPHKPGKSYILGYDNKAFRILEIVFFVIGCIPIAVCICITFFA